MATALVQGKGFLATSGAFASNVTAGHLLVCGAFTASGSATQSTCSDTRTNTWTQAGVFQDATGGVTLGLWFTFGGSSGADTVTPTFSTAVEEMWLAEFSGPTSASLDGTAHGVRITATTPWVTPTDTTTGANDLLIHLALGTGFTPTFNSPWSLVAAIPGDTVNVMGWRGDVASGTIAPNLGWSGSETGSSYVVAISTPLTAGTAATPGESPLLEMLSQPGLGRAQALELLWGTPPVPPAVVVQTTSQAPLVVTPPTPVPPGGTQITKGRDGIVRSTPGPPTVVTKPTEPIPGHSLIFTGLDGVSPAGPGALLVTKPTDPIPGTFITRVGDPNAAPPSVPFTPAPLFVTSPTPQPIPQTLIRRGTDDALQLNSPGPQPLIVTSSAVVEGKTLLRKGTDDAIQIGTITPQPTVISARSIVPLPEVLIVKGGVTSVQVEASGQTDIVFGSTAIPTVSASASAAIIFNATGVPTESATGTSSIIFNSTGAGTTPGGATTYMSMRGVNSAFVNVASATTDAPFTGGIVPAARAGQVINVLAVTFNADTAADTIVFNSKGAGAGTAISALFSNPINGSVVWPFTPVGWFTTNGGEQLTVTTTGASPTHVQIIFEYLNA